MLDVGGNYMTTGDGIVASSYLVATQNELPLRTDNQTPDPCTAIIEARMQYILAQFIASWRSTPITC